MVVRWLAIMLLCACVEPELVPCGDLWCPRDSLCVEQSCVSTRCGNLVVDTEEVCDDGNAMSGDGCRADCSKVEACGDAVVDAGERCDDGNANEVDGCDACVATTWHATALTGGTDPLETALLTPFGAVMDEDGHLYVSDSSDHRVYRITLRATGNVISVIAGTGANGSSGDGGPAVNAKLTTPSALALDEAGNLYIADTFDHRIRRVDRAGIITTFAGDGIAGYNGDGVFAGTARLNMPGAVAVDASGAVLIADSGNSRLRRVANGLITTMGQPGGNPFSGPLNQAAFSPLSLAIDGTDIYVGEPNQVRRIRNDFVAVITSGINPFVSVGPDHVLYMAEPQINLIRRISPTGGGPMIGTGTAGFTGDGGPASEATLRSPRAVAVDPSGVLYIADSGNHRIRRVDAAGIISTVVGGGTVETSATNLVVFPTDLTRDASGNLVVATTSQVVRITPDNAVTPLLLPDTASPASRCTARMSTLRTGRASAASMRTASSRRSQEPTTAASAAMVDRRPPRNSARTCTSQSTPPARSTSRIPTTIEFAGSMWRERSRRCHSCSTNLAASPSIFKIG